jgi:hypothetical protein
MFSGFTTAWAFSWMASFLSSGQTCANGVPQKIALRERSYITIGERAEIPLHCVAKIVNLIEKLLSKGSALQIRVKICKIKNA